MSNRNLEMHEQYSKRNQYFIDFGHLKTLPKKKLQRPDQKATTDFIVATIKSASKQNSRLL